MCPWGITHLLKIPSFRSAVCQLRDVIIQNNKPKEVEGKGIILNQEYEVTATNERSFHQLSPAHILY